MKWVLVFFALQHPLNGNSYEHQWDRHELRPYDAKETCDAVAVMLNLGTGNVTYATCEWK
jgi:hypothetical protein